METPKDTLTNIRTRGDFRALSERASQGRPRESASEKLPSDSPIWDAWENLKAAYPASTANWEAAPPDVWAAMLGDLTGEQLLNGLRNLVHHQDSRGRNDFPPNAPQFRDLCLSDFHWESAAQRIDFTGTALIEDLTSKEKRNADGKAHMAKIMDIIRTPKGSNAQ